ARLAAHWREWLLVLAMLAVSYLVLEIGYRGYQSWALPRALFEIVDRQKSSGPTSTDQFMFDVHVGYRYTPNFVGERGHPWFSHWRTIAMGTFRNSNTRNASRRASIGSPSSAIR
ncbi:MAG: hypothetical protein ACJ8FP_25885, partial [Xanthobacteraceae bacterium]